MTLNCMAAHKTVPKRALKMTIYELLHAVLLAIFVCNEVHFMLLWLPLYNG